MVTYKWIDYDAETRTAEFPRWTEACEFMRQLLIDGYIILGVEFC